MFWFYHLKLCAAPHPHMAVVDTRPQGRQAGTNQL